jgi:hypothetical protein
MCQHLKLLIEEDDGHYVGQCEHGTVHLVWAHLSLHLRANDFVALTDTVIAACLQAGAPPDSPAVTYHLRLGDMQLEMGAEPFWRLADLMRRAAEVIAQRPGFRPARKANWAIEVRAPVTLPRVQLGLN